MCGLVGFLDQARVADEGAARRLIVAMSDRIAHRGPDDAGSWIDPSGIAFGFRRLSIVDLTASGHQPMLSANERYVLMLNGEIYNFGELRAEIEAARGLVAWRGRSDTEVLVEAVALWGVQAAITRANGMFAVAVWDRAERTLWLARDRIGKKPLHYGWAGGSFVFGSELKALWPYPGFDFSICPDALADFLQLGYVPAPSTIFRSIAKLRPGHLLRLDCGGPGRPAQPVCWPYWTLAAAAARGLEDQRRGRVPGTDELDALLRDAVARRMIADVPVGTFLSGGIDSSLVTALMTASSGAEVRSYSIGFGAEAWNEARQAEAVARHLGTRHTEAYVNAAEAMDVMAAVVGIQDEPFADHSIIPTTLLSRLARREVTVALSGDGGDELFGGYDRYAIAAHWLARRAAIPPAALPLARTLLATLVVPAARIAGHSERRLALLSALFAGDQPERFGEALLSPVIDPATLMAGATAQRHPLLDPAYRLGQSGTLDRLTFMDTSSYLVDGILAKVDRASMSASLEVRCPLLDYRVVEMSWRIPAADKMQGGRGKLPLRAVLDRYVPRALIERPKMGFGAPVEVWLRNGMRDWAETLMSPQALGRHGLLNVAACRRLWQDFAQRGGIWNGAIWNVLMFQAWWSRMQYVPGVAEELVLQPRAADPAFVAQPG